MKEIKISRIENSKDEQGRPCTKLTTVYRGCEFDDTFQQIVDKDNEESGGLVDNEEYFDNWKTFEVAWLLIQRYFKALTDSGINIAKDIKVDELDETGAFYYEVEVF